MSNAAEQGLGPEQLMRATVDGLIEVGETMLGLSMSTNGGIGTFQEGDLDCGTCISMTRPGGSWNLAIFGSDSGTQLLARALLGMEEGERVEKPDLADALGEILNMVAGVIKRKVSTEDAKAIQLGLPLFLSGTDCFRYLAKGIKIFCQRLTGPEVDMEVIIVWKEVP